MCSRVGDLGRSYVSFTGTNWPESLSRPPTLAGGFLLLIVATPRERNSGEAAARSSSRRRKRYEVNASRRAGVAPVKAAPCAPDAKHTEEACILSMTATQPILYKRARERFL